MIDLLNTDKKLLKEFFLQQLSKNGFDVSSDSFDISFEDFSGFEQSAVDSRYFVPDGNGSGVFGGSAPVAGSAKSVYFGQLTIVEWLAVAPSSDISLSIRKGLASNKNVKEVILDGQRWDFSAAPVADYLVLPSVKFSGDNVLFTYLAGLSGSATSRFWSVGFNGVVLNLR